MGVIDLMRNGVPLVGMQERPSGFKRLMVPATMTEEELSSSSSVWRRKALMGVDKRRDVKEEDPLVSATNLEVEAGFLQGPYCEDVSVLLDSEKWCLNPRFALFQEQTKSE